MARRAVLLLVGLLAACAHVGEGRRLTACVVIPRVHTVTRSEEATAIAEVVNGAFAASPDCEDVEATAEARAEAFATAVAFAIGRTEALVLGPDCAPGSGANAIAAARGVATAIAAGYARAVAVASNQNADAIVAKATAIEEVIKEAIAIAETKVDGVGVDPQTVISVEIAEALAISLAQALTEVFCDK